MPEQALPTIAFDWSKVDRKKMTNSFCDGIAEAAKGTDTPLDDYAIEFVRSALLHDSPRIFMESPAGITGAKALPFWLKPILLKLLDVLF